MIYLSLSFFCKLIYLSLKLLIFVSFIESSDKNLYYIGLSDILCTLNFNKYKDIESCPVKCKYWKW